MICITYPHMECAIFMKLDHFINSKLVEHRKYLETLININILN